MEKISAVMLGLSAVAIAGSAAARRGQVGQRLDRARQGQPGKIIFGASAAGSGPNLNGARFALAAGIKTVTVAFKGASEQVIEVAAGRIHYTIVSAFAAMPFSQDGNLSRLVREAGLKPR
jgi:tripartite-type tricarboxylate transporter receptor subunit TctC